jgi:CRP-like cAMP-binding protein
VERIRRLLGELSLFESFSPEDLGSLIARSRVTTYAPRETIIAYGQPGRDLIVILDGTAEVVVADARGERQRIAERSRGDFLGEISLLTGEPTTADVIALQHCEALRIPQDTFSTYLSVNPAALRVMAKTITERLRWREHDEAAQARVEDAWRRAPDPYGLELSTANPMRVLTVECTGSSVTVCYFDTAHDGGALRARVDGIGTDSAFLSHSAGCDSARERMGPLDHRQAVRAIAELLAGPVRGVAAQTAMAAPR